MPVRVSIKINQYLSNEQFDVFNVNVSFKDNEELTCNDILLELAKINPKNNCWLPFPYGEHLALQSKTAKEGASGDARPSLFILEPNRKLISFFAEKGAFLDKLKLVQYSGIISQIERRKEFSSACEDFAFNQHLLRIGIDNPSLTLLNDSPQGTKIKRAHLVHKIFLDDSEISAGLHISLLKNKQSDEVIYISNPDSLNAVLNLSDEPITLIIDGHWEHGARLLPHGIWGLTNAEHIAQELLNLVEAHPDKIKYIRLLGCHSGMLSPFEELSGSCNPKKLIFKNEVVAGFEQKEMSEFRNRCVYVSDGELPFHPDSLVSLVYSKLSQYNIPITAHPKISLPFPADVKQSRFNLGTDCEVWSGPYFWKKPKLELPDWWVKLNTVKSITILSQAAYDSLSIPESRWIKKI